MGAPDLLIKIKTSNSDLPWVFLSSTSDKTRIWAIFHMLDNYKNLKRQIRYPGKRKSLLLTSDRNKDFKDFKNLLYMPYSWTLELKKRSLTSVMVSFWPLLGYIMYYDFSNIAPYPILIWRFGSRNKSVKTKFNVQFHRDHI